MNKRRAEIVALAALVVVAAAERPSLTVPPISYQVADLAPQRVETFRDLGVIAVKLMVSWIG